MCVSWRGHQKLQEAMVLVVGPVAAEAVVLQPVAAVVVATVVAAVLRPVAAVLVAMAAAVEVEEVVEVAAAVEVVEAVKVVEVVEVVEAVVEVVRVGSLALQRRVQLSGAGVTAAIWRCDLSFSKMAPAMASRALAVRSTRHAAMSWRWCQKPCARSCLQSSCSKGSAAEIDNATHRLL